MVVVAVEVWLKTVILGWISLNLVPLVKIFFVIETLALDHWTWLQFLKICWSDKMLTTKKYFVHFHSYKIFFW